MAVFLVIVLLITQFASGQNNNATGMKMAKQMGFGGGFLNKNMYANGTFVNFTKNNYGNMENYSVNGLVTINSITFSNTTTGEWSNKSFMDIYENRFFKESIFDDPMAMISINTKVNNKITIDFNSSVIRSTTFNGVFINKNNGMLIVYKGHIYIKNTTVVVNSIKDSKILIIFNDENYFGKLGLSFENVRIDAIINIFSYGNLSYNQTILMDSNLSITTHVNGNAFSLQISSTMPRDIFILLRIYPIIENTVVKIDGDAVSNSTIYQTLNSTGPAYTNENINGSMVYMVHLGNYTYHSLDIYSNFLHSYTVYYFSIFGSIILISAMAYFVYRKSR